MTWKDGFYAALLQFTQSHLGYSDAVQVTDFNVTKEDRGYCETCSYTTTVVQITYRDRKGRHRQADWDGNFAELMGYLTDE